MSCTAIVSIPVVLTCMHAVSEQERQKGLHGWLRGGRFTVVFINGGKTGWDATFVSRLAIISVIYLERNSGNKQAKVAMCHEQVGGLAFHRCQPLGRAALAKSAMC